MQTVEILGHTQSAVYKKRYFTEVEYQKQLDKTDRKSRRLNRKLIRKGIRPRLRQVKIEFTRSNILVNIYKPDDFVFKKPVYSYKIKYRDIDRAEIRVIGNNNEVKFTRDFKIRFYNELNEEILYLNFGSNNEFYNYQNSLKGYQLLVAHLNINDIEYAIIDETVFR